MTSEATAMRMNTPCGGVFARSLYLTPCSREAFASLTFRANVIVFVQFLGLSKMLGDSRDLSRAVADGAPAHLKMARSPVDVRRLGGIFPAILAA